MKRNATLTIATITLITLASCGETKNKQDAKISTPEEIETEKENMAEIADASFSDGMTGKVFHNYQQIRMALINSDSNEVTMAAGNLAESFTEEREDMKSMAMAMAEADDIEKQRELFSHFTANVEPLFKDALSEGTIYKQFCPMAFEGKGGYWLSNAEEIRNPYYGQKMLKCGKVTEKIEK
ncbi:DUF3347 domain-containing protein [Maribacter sp. LLG6340-A2]|uniref:DUF3347 domain-containing protein n=1 Tax=Maribacter sp. LLG6340-A2 TaxID=3160834 RepID=UPI0038666418